MSTTIEQVSGLYEIADYMQDDELSQALEFIAKWKEKVKAWNERVDSW